jgi:multidrug efflux system membrane fusion protein
VSINGEKTTIDPGMWVTGQPDNSVIVTLGQEIVFPGQVVNIDSSWSSISELSL